MTSPLDIDNAGDGAAAVAAILDIPAPAKWDHGPIGSSPAAGVPADAHGLPLTDPAPR